jgi:peptide/nickel transport system permease protein
MLKYIFKRVLFFVPTIFAISLLTFILMSSAPGDPAELMLNRAVGGDGGQAADKLAGDKAYNMVRKRLGLDLPLFYFSFSNLASTDTLHRIAKIDHRKTLDRLTSDYGNWKEIEAYYHSAKKLELTILDIPKDSSVTTPLIALRNAVNNLYLNYNDKAIRSSFAEMQQQMNQGEKLAKALPALNATVAAYDAVQQNPTKWKNYIPTLHINGTKNQYHRWLFGDAPWFSSSEDETLSRGFIRGDFGTSYFAKRPVGTLVWESIGYTMTISLISILITYLISIPLGVFSAVNKGTTADQSLSTGLFILYSMPSFWIATMMIIFLGGGDFLDLFPPTGVADVDEDDPFFARLGMQIFHLTMPMICWTYGSFAYLSRQMRGGMLAVLQQDYIRTARSKGLNNNVVVWKHAFRNSLLPVITIFSSVFPAMIGGSVILEFIFTIPGMGKLGFEAVIRRDYPVVLTVTMFSAILTLVGYLVSDILYAVVDPRISYSKK